MSEDMENGALEEDLSSSKNEQNDPLGLETQADTKRLRRITLIRRMLISSVVVAFLIGASIHALASAIPSDIATQDTSSTAQPATEFDQLALEDRARPAEETAGETNQPISLTVEELQGVLSSLTGDDSLRGLGGYITDASEEEVLISALDGLSQAGYSVGFVMMDITTGHGVASNVDELYYGASSFKGIYVASLVSWKPEVLGERKEAIYYTLSISSGDDYAALRTEYGNEPIELWCEKAGVDTTLGSEWYPYLSVKTLARLWLQNYSFFASDSQTVNDLIPLYYETDNSAISRSLGQLYTVCSKAGWIYDEEYSAAVDAGIVYAGENPYLLVIMSDAPGETSMLDSLVLALNTIHEGM